MSELIPDYIKSIVQFIKQGDSFIIVSHDHPDGDSLGSQFALALGLQSLGKKVEIHSQKQVPKIYDFLPGRDLTIVSKEVRVNNEKILIILDSGELERANLLFIPDLPSFIINIDHHVSNTNFGQLNWVDTSASATSEIIFQLLMLLDIKLTPSIATNLYTGILTDTGSFQYSNTSAGCLKIASQLVSAGVNPHAISLAVYDRKTIPALRLMGIVLSDMEIYKDQKFALLTVTRKMLELLNATYEDTEDIVSLPQKIENIEVSVLIKEIKENEYKISFRTKGLLNASLMAERLNGGGHPNAAGATMKGNLPQIKEKILLIVENALKEA